MTEEEIARIARIQHVSEEDVRRILADQKRMQQVMQKFPGCTETSAVLYLIDKEKMYYE